MSLVGLSFPARLRVGGVGAPGSSAEDSDVIRERRALHIWRQQLLALIDASSAPESPHAPGVKWQVHLFQWTRLCGPTVTGLGDQRREIDPERIIEWLRQDPEPFRDRLST